MPKQTKNKWNQRGCQKWYNKTKITEQIQLPSDPLLEVCKLPVYQRQRYFSILTGNYGVEQLCRALLHDMQLDYHYDSDSDDYEEVVQRRTSAVSADQLIYIVVMCHAARCYTVAGRNGIPADDIDELENIIQGIQLPSMLCDYIESIGIVKLPTGLNVIPWCARRDVFYAPDLAQLTPEKILTRAGRTIPDNYWCIDRDWISNWNQTGPIIFGAHRQFRRINWKNDAGRIEMVVTPLESTDDDPNFVTPTSPCHTSEAEITLGAAYNFRQVSKRSVWPAETSVVCTDFFRGTEFHPSEILSRLIIHSRI